MENDIKAIEITEEQMDEVSGGKVVAGGMKDKPAAKAGYIVHQITATDTLTRIANKYGTTVKALMEANPTIKDAHWIRTGYYLYVPSKKK